MKKILVLIVFSVLIFNAQSQELVYDAHAEVRKIESFDRIRVNGAIAVYLSQGTEQALAISSEDGKYNDKIETEVRNGELKIYVESGNWNNWNWGNKSLKAYITVTELQDIDINGASSCKITGLLKVTDLNIDLSGASVIKGEIAAENLSFNLSGASVAEVNGTTNELSVDASGASGFRGYDLTSETARVSASGASGISVNVSKELQANASGVSNVSYKGGAVIRDLDVSGGSTIKKKD